MIVAAMIGYYVLAIGLIALTGYLTGRQVNRELTAAADRAIEHLRESAARTPPLEPYVREPMPAWEESEPELRITIRRHPESDDGELPKAAAGAIRAVSRFEEDLGGDGLDYDPAGTVEEPDRVVLRLVPRRDDWEAADRLAAVADEVNRASREAGQPAVDLPTRIARELRSKLPPGVVAEVVFAGPEPAGVG